MVAATSGMLRSFRHPNYRRWYIGQGISMIGFWGQVVAQALLVLELTDNGAMLGFVAALRFVPILVVGPWAGVLSDRVDKRRMMIATQSVTMVVTLVFASLVLSGHATITWVVVLAALTGIAWSIDQPTRRTIVVELVPIDDVANAVSLNSTLIQLAKVIGPTIAGILIAVAGIGWCFMLNALTYVAVLAALVLIDPQKMHRSTPVPKASGQVRAGFAYVWHDRQLRFPLMMLGVVGSFSFNWNVLLPLLATRDLGGTASTYAFLMGCMSVGSIAGGLWLARRRAVDLRFIAASCAAFGVASGVLTLMPSVAGVAACSALVGAGSIIYVNATVMRLQMRSVADMRGRVMSVFSIVWLGSLALGGTVAGIVAQASTARTSLALGAVVAAVSGGVVLALSRRGPSPVASDQLDDLPVDEAAERGR